MAKAVDNLSPRPRVIDPTAALRMRRYRARKRNGPPVTVRPRSVTLAARQEAAIDLLLDVIEAHGERPGPDGEPVAPLAAWRAALRSRGRTNARQVRRLTQGLIDLGAVLERDGMVAVGDYGVEIARAP